MDDPVLESALTPEDEQRDALLDAAQYARGDVLLARIVDFTRLLWELGMDVGAGRAVEIAQSLPLVNVTNRGDFYSFLKVNLVSRHEQEQLFDQAFAFFWRSRHAGGSQIADESNRHHRRALALPAHRQPEDAQQMTRFGMRSHQSQRHPLSRLSQARTGKHDEQDKAGEHRGTYSDEELLRQKDFENFSWDELEEARALMARMRWRLGERRTRRLRPARRGRMLDVRRTLRRSLRTGGEPIILARRAIRRRPRPLVIICDISGSMSLYSRLLLHFVHTVSNGLSNVETFVFATRLTRITRQLARRDVDEAIHDVTRSVQDWSGGTRIGEALRTFNYRWSRRVLGRGAVVLIISDGWDRGDVRVLSQEMARLQRNCHRLIWLNPLLGQDDYLPVTAGMRAALPYIDDFLPANNLDSLFALASTLEAVDEGRVASRGARGSTARATDVASGGAVKARL